MAIQPEHRHQTCTLRSRSAHIQSDTKTYSNKGCVLAHSMAHSQTHIAGLGQRTCPPQIDSSLLVMHPNTPCCPDKHSGAPSTPYHHTLMSHCLPWSKKSSSQGTHQPIQLLARCSPCRRPQYLICNSPALHCNMLHSHCLPLHHSSSSCDTAILPSTRHRACTHPLRSAGIQNSTPTRSETARGLAQAQA